MKAKIIIRSTDTCVSSGLLLSNGSPFYQWESSEGLMKIWKL